MGSFKNKMRVRLGIESEHEMHMLRIIIIAIKGLSKTLGQDVRIEEPYWRH